MDYLKYLVGFGSFILVEAFVRVVVFVYCSLVKFFVIRILLGVPVHLLD